MKLSQIDYDQILAVLKNKIENIIDTNAKKLRSHNDACWSVIGKQFNFHISSKNSYLIVKEDIYSNNKLNFKITVSRGE